MLTTVDFSDNPIGFLIVFFSLEKHFSHFILQFSSQFQNIKLWRWFSIDSDAQTVHFLCPMISDFMNQENVARILTYLMGDSFFSQCESTTHVITC